MTCTVFRERQPHQAELCIDTRKGKKPLTYSNPLLLQAIPSIDINGIIFDRLREFQH